MSSGKAKAIRRQLRKMYGKQLQDEAQRQIGGEINKFLSRHLSPFQEKIEYDKEIIRKWRIISLALVVVIVAMIAVNLYLYFSGA